MTTIDTPELSELLTELQHSASYLEARKKLIAYIDAKIAEKQAVIDYMMLEWVPSEMTQEQIETWVKNQIPARLP